MSDDAESPNAEDATLALPQFEPHERVCGNCKLWRAHSIDVEKGWIGNCRIQSNRGLFPPSAPLCDGFAPRGEVSATREVAVARRPRAIANIQPLIRSANGGIRPPFGSTIVPTQDSTTPVDLEGETMTRQELMELFLEASGQTDVVLAPKWEGGTISLIPANKELQPKEIPLDALFNKVVMIRDRLRTLEQKVNAHPKLSGTEKVEFQQYITRCYGSLTTFNVLFKEKRDQFVGQKGEE